MMNPSTICAIATAPGGAIGIVRVSGPDAVALTDKIFRSPSGKTLKDASGYSLHYGHIVFSAPERNGEIIDEVLLSVFRAPASYTGEDSVEINCHGSAYILQQVCNELVLAGCEAAAPGEFTQRAFLNGKMDLAQAEAVADLIASSNAATHRLSMSQMRGGFSRELGRLRDQLLKLTSLLELELDFSDHEDLEFADRTELQTVVAEVKRTIVHLADSFATGNAIKNGIPVAIIGAPNVGKSTLLNALLHDDKAIVSDIQGTTRDLIEDTIQLGGHTFRFIDTAGIRTTDDTIEQMGIERSLKAAERAQIIILITENGVKFPEIQVAPEQQVLCVINKIDQAASLPFSKQQTALDTFFDTRLSDINLRISARTGQGVSALENELVKVANKLLAVNDSEVIVTNARHYAALCAARENLDRVEDGFAMGLSGDLIAQDLRESLFHLAEIIGGEVTSDEVLGNIFSHFCIGK